MNDWLTGAVLAVGLVTCAVLAVLMVRDRLAEDRTFALLIGLEALLLVQLVVGCVALGTTGREVQGVLFVSYLVGNALALPVGAFWSIAERTRSGTAVLLVATITVLALQLRLEQIWGTGG